MEEIFKMAEKTLQVFKGFRCICLSGSSTEETPFISCSLQVYVVHLHDAFSLLPLQKKQTNQATFFLTYSISQAACILKQSFLSPYGHCIFPSHITNKFCLHFMIGVLYYYIIKICNKLHGMQRCLSSSISLSKPSNKATLIPHDLKTCSNYFYRITGLFSLLLL